MQLISSLVTQKMPWHANFTELNHLMASGNARPQQLEVTAKQIFASQTLNGGMNPLSSLSLGSDLEVTSMNWEWEMRGATERPLIVLEDVETASGPLRGIQNTEFRIKLDENWYKATDVIDPGTSGHKFLCRIMEDPTPHGNGWIYKMRLMNSDPNAGVPAKYFTPGQTWAKLFATAEEGSYQSGSTQYSNKIAMKDGLGKIKKMYEVTDYAAEEYLAIAFRDNKGSEHNRWIRYAEVEFHQQWLKEIERAIFYNRKDPTIKGGTGRPVDSFAGIQQKLEESGNNHVHSRLTPKLLQEYFMDIFYSRVKLENIDNIVGFTGYYGMFSFHEMMNAFVQKEGWTLLNSNFNIQKATSPYHKNAFRYGYKFTEWLMPMGGTFKLVHNPIYDDRMINREIDPVTGYPLESQRYTFLDFTEVDGASNFRVVIKKDGFKFWYIPGGISPYGPMKGTQGATAREGYEMHYSKELGVHLQDPTRCGELILCRN
jgi:hypothetical protein